MCEVMNNYIDEEKRIRIEKMIKKGYSTSEIADIYDMPVEEIKKIEASLLQKS